MDGCLRPGDVLGEYTVESCIGLGGSAEVYLVHKYPDELPYAMKILSPEKAKQDPTLKERFLREASISIKFCHKNLVQVYETALDSVSGLQYIIMEYLNQKSLHERISGKPIPEEEAIHYAINIAQALFYAEKHKLVHRDLKPANILLDSDGRVKLADMGIAHLIDDTSFGTITMDTSVVGTPSYSSPEQCRASHNVDCRADIYSLGACMYEMLTGHAPFTGNDPFDVIAKVQKDDPVPPIELNPNISPMINELILQMLKKNPEDRPQSAKEIIERLRRIIQRYFHQKNNVLSPEKKFRYTILFIVFLLVLLIFYAVICYYQKKNANDIFLIPTSESPIKRPSYSLVSNKTVKQKEKKSTPEGNILSVPEKKRPVEKTVLNVSETELLNAVFLRDTVTFKKWIANGFEIKEMEKRYPNAWKKLKQQYDSMFIEAKNSKGHFTEPLLNEMMFFSELQTQIKLPSRSFSEDELLLFFYSCADIVPYRGLIRSVFRENPHLYEPVLYRFLTTTDRPCSPKSLQLLEPDISKKQFKSYNPMDIVISDGLFAYMQNTLRMTPSGKYTAPQLTLYRNIYNRRFEPGKKPVFSMFDKIFDSKTLNSPMPDRKLPLYAALKISTQSAENLIKLNANVNVLDSSGLPIAALFINDMKSLKFLLDHKADPLMKFNCKGLKINLLEYAQLQKNTEAEKLILPYMLVEHDVLPSKPKKRIQYVNPKFPLIIKLKFSSPWEMQGGRFTPDLIFNDSLNLPGKHPYDPSLPQSLRGYMCQVTIPPYDLHQGLSVRLFYRVKKADKPFVLLAGGRKNQWFRIVMYPQKRKISIFLGKTEISVPKDFVEPGSLEKLDVCINFTDRFIYVEYQNKGMDFNLPKDANIPSLSGPDNVFTFCDYARKTPPAVISYEEFIVSNKALERDKSASKEQIPQEQIQKMQIQYAELRRKNKDFSCKIVAEPSSQRFQSIRHLKKRIALLNDLLERFAEIKKSSIYQEIKLQRDLDQIMLRKLDRL